MGQLLTAPYGSWPSPLSASAAVAGTRGLDDVVAIGTQVWWLQSDPDDGGRISVWTSEVTDGGAGAARSLTPEHNVRTGVHEYGGGAWTVNLAQSGQPVVVYSSWPDHQLWIIEGDDAPRPLTAAHSGLRYADLRVFPDRGLIIAVREDHRSSGAEPRNELVSLAYGGDGQESVLASGADFYASPELSEQGTVAWIEWDHPAMPWDHTRLMVGTLDDSGRALNSVRTVVDQPDTSVLFPLWHKENLLYSHDRGGWWQLWSLDPDSGVDARCLWAGEHDVVPPMWTFGNKPYVALSAGVLAAWFVDGRRCLGVIPYAGGEPQVLTPALDDVAALSGNEELIAMITSSAVGPTAVETFAVADFVGSRRVITRASEAELDPGWMSVPESVWWEGSHGKVQAWYYPPTSLTHQAPAAELPPMIVKSHGGPTSFSRPKGGASVWYWTSRGYAYIDVNYGGSSGFGRAYRSRLNGQWGIVDVEDCIEAATAMADQGRADPQRLIITGGSAGGFTTLAALARSDVFAAGMSLYGVSDLTALARDTHKFESRYLDGLVGRWPEDEAIYRARSPISQVDQITSPMLLLQGSEDKVVPPSQAEMIAEAVRAKGLPVSLIMYEGEGHGFRQAPNVINSLESMQAFLSAVLTISAADQLPKLIIDNLSTAVDLDQDHVGG